MLMVDVNRLQWNQLKLEHVDVEALLIATPLNTAEVVRAFDKRPEYALTSADAANRFKVAQSLKVSHGWQTDVKILQAFDSAGKPNRNTRALIVRKIGSRFVAKRGILVRS